MTNNITLGAELQRRAAEEREKKAKAERRRNRNNNKHLADIADPNDCLTYTVYPIEPEVLVSIWFASVLVLQRSTIVVVHSVP